MLFWKEKYWLLPKEILFYLLFKFEFELNLKILDLFYWLVLP